MIIKKRNIFYGWWIVFFTAIIRYIESGTFFYGAGVFFTPIRKTFSWSYAQTSVVFTLQRLEAGIMAPVAGFLVDKMGPKRMILIGWVISGLGFILMSRISSLWSFYITFIIIAIGMSFGSFMPANTVVSRWFIKKRSRALTFSALGAGLSGTVVQILEFIIRKVGWRPTLTVTGIATWLICLPIGFLIRDNPRSYGLLPDGEKPLSVDGSAETLKNGISEEQTESDLIVTEHDYTVREAIKTRAFWMLCMVFLFQQIGTGAVFVHMIPYMETINFTRAAAAASISAMTICSLIGRLGFGILGDFFSKRYLMTIALAVQTTGIFIYSMLDPEKLWLLIVFLLIYAPGYGAPIVLKPGIQADYFGTKHFGKIMGAMSVITLPGGLFSPVIAGYIFDITGSYVLAWQIFALISLPAIPLMMAKAPLYPSEKVSRHEVRQ